MKSKYPNGVSMEEWFRKLVKEMKNSSLVWKALVNAFPLIRKWSIGYGRKIRLSKDPWVGADAGFK